MNLYYIQVRTRTQTNCWTKGKKKIMTEEQKNQAPKPNPTAAKPKQNEEMKYIISKFSPVYVVSWAGDQTNCSICKNDFLSPCAACEAKNIEEPCPVQEGACGHKFHMHCISKWIKNSPTCPMCNAPWEAKNEFG